MSDFRLDKVASSSYTVSCLLNNDRDTFGWVNLRANLGLNPLYALVQDT